MTSVTALEHLPLSELWAFSPLCAKGSCNCQQCAIVLGRTREEVAPSSAHGSWIVHFPLASVLDRTWLGQKQHQVTGGVRRPWGRLPPGVHWNRQSRLWVCSSLWPTRLGRDPRNVRSCDGTCWAAVTVTRRTGYLLSHAIPVRLGIYIAVPLPFLLASPEIPFPGCGRQLFGK